MKRNMKEEGFYHTPAWRKIRKLALQRDHYLCQECLKADKITRATEVHHIETANDNPDKALTLDNLVSLCWDCHEKTKTKKKMKNAPGVVRIISMREKF
jgi:5-methylcytosine-specific restriction protein A